MRRDSAENRQRILNVFAQSIRQDPSGLPTMTDIVSRTGLGRGTVYRHFRQPGDILYAYLEDGFTQLCATYEPEWIKTDDDDLKSQFRVFLLRWIAFTLEHSSFLKTAEFYESEGRKLAAAELRRKIFVTATRLSPQPLKPIELSKWVDVIAHCVEVDHLTSGSPKEVLPELSATIAMALLDDAITH